MNMGRTLVSVVAVGAALLPCTSWASGYAVDSHSATAAAMGGVGVANPYETNTSFYNPAMTPQNELSFSISAMPSFRGTEFTSTDGDTTEGVDGSIPLPSANLSYAIGDLGIGLGFYKPFAHEIQYPGDWSGRSLIRWKVDTSTLAPNVAYEFGDTGLSASVGAQLMWSSIGLTQGLPSEVADDGISEVVASGFGVGASAALFFETDLGLTFGLTYHSGVNVEYEGDVQFFNGDGSSLTGGFNDQDVSSELKFPHRITAGLGYEIDKLWLGIDVGFTTWSSWANNEIRFSDPCEVGSTTCDPVVDSTDPPAVEFPAVWEDTPTFRFGAQYRVLESVDLRAGFAYEPTPVPDSDVGPAAPLGNRAVLGAGAGFEGEYLRVDGSYQFINDTRDVQNGGADGQYRNTEHVMGVTLTAQFDP